MRDVPRHLIVPLELRERAYEPRPLPIGEGQTISQPYVVGFMTEILRLQGTDRVLEVGTGSGYQAAIAGRIAAEVYTVEIFDFSPRAAARRSPTWEPNGPSGGTLHAGGKLRSTHHRTCAGATSPSPPAPLKNGGGYQALRRPS
jgi:hypothetical protein